MRWKPLHGREVGGKNRARPLHFQPMHFMSKTMGRKVFMAALLKTLRGKIDLTAVEAHGPAEAVTVVTQLQRFMSVGLFILYARCPVVHYIR